MDICIPEAQTHQSRNCEKVFSSLCWSISVLFDLVFSCSFSCSSRQLWPMRTSSSAGVMFVHHIAPSPDSSWTYTDNSRATQEIKTYVIVLQYLSKRFFLTILIFQFPQLSVLNADVARTGDTKHKPRPTSPLKSVHQVQSSLQQSLTYFFMMSQLIMCIGHQWIWPSLISLIPFWN